MCYITDLESESKKAFFVLPVCVCARAHVCESKPLPWGRDVSVRMSPAASDGEMAALRQEHRYGLSCGKINKNTPNQTLYHVKLTDTAIRTLEAYQNLKVRQFFRSNFGACVCFSSIFSFSL